MVDTIGVNIHTNYSDTIYGDQARTLRLLKDLGVRHVRDGLKSSHPTMHRALRELRDAGIKTSLIADPAGRYGAGSLADQVAALKDPNRLQGVAATIEGPNELECGDSSGVDRAREQQKQLAAALEKEPTLREIPLLGPSWCRGNKSVLAYGNDGANSDAWNLHPYPGGYMPEAMVGGQLGPEQGISGQVKVAHSVEKQPVYATETGYHNAVRGDGRGHNPTSEKASGPYAARLVLEYHRLGVKRAFFYELQNERSETSLVDREQHFGLVRYDGSLKPSYHHLKTLISTLSDPGASPGNRPVRVGLSNAPEDLRTMAFSRHDGSVDLVLWRAASLWDVSNKRDLTVPEAKVGISTEKSVAASSVNVSNGPSRTSLGNGTSFALPVGGSPVVVRLVGLGTTPTTPTPTTPTPTTPTPTTPASPGVRVNAGATAASTVGGTNWSADTGFAGGIARTVSTTVAGTSSPELHRTYRFGMTGYNLPVANGTYSVRLLMHEPYWTSAGKRVFSITAEGRTAVDKLDLFGAAGKDKAVERSFTTTVTDGTLDLGFVRGLDNPIVSAIQVTPAG